MKIQNVVKHIKENTDEVKYEIEEELDYLQERRIEEDYLSNLTNKKITDMKSLLDFYLSLEDNIKILNFERFVNFVMENDDKSEELLNELRNLTLLNRTGLYKFSKEQESYSKQIVSNFLLKVGRIVEEKKEKPSYEKIDELNEKQKLIDKYIKLFTPVGITKEIDDPKELNSFINTIDLSDEDKTNVLLMSLKSNHSYHKSILSNYEERKDLTKLSIETDIEKEKKKELEIIALNVLEKVNKRDVKVIEKAQDYLNTNNKQIDLLTSIEVEDLKNTMNVYKEEPDLREEVYRTTENIEQLLTYEINEVFKTYENDPDNIMNMVKDLKPVVSYINKLNKSKKEKNK